MLKFEEDRFDLFLEGFVDHPFSPLPTTFDFISGEFNLFGPAFFREDEDVREIHFS